MSGDEIRLNNYGGLVFVARSTLRSGLGNRKRSCSAVHYKSGSRMFHVAGRMEEAVGPRRGNGVACL